MQTKVVATASKTPFETGDSFPVAAISTRSHSYRAREATSCSGRLHSDPTHDNGGYVNSDEEGPGNALVGPFDGLFQGSGRAWGPDWFQFPASWAFESE